MKRLHITLLIGALAATLAAPYAHAETSVVVSVPAQVGTQDMYEPLVGLNPTTSHEDCLKVRGLLDQMRSEDKSFPGMQSDEDVCDPQKSHAQGMIERGSGPVEPESGCYWEGGYIHYTGILTTNLALGYAIDRYRGSDCANANYCAILVAPALGEAGATAAGGSSGCEVQAGPAVYFQHKPGGVGIAWLVPGPSANFFQWCLQC